MTFDQLLPVFLSYPPQDQSEWELPFKFAGGFGLSSSRIGGIFSIYGIIGMTLQVGTEGGAFIWMLTLTLVLLFPADC